MHFVQGLFGKTAQEKAIIQAQREQKAELAKQKANTDAKESALMRLFSGGQGRTLSGGLATTLGG